MNEKDIKYIESALDIKLSDSYKKTMIEYPFKDKSFYSAVYKGLLDDAALLVKLNQTYRNTGFKKKEWPSNFYIIGKISDTIYFVDLKASDEIIYSISEDKQFNAKNKKKYRMEDTFAEYIDFLKMLQDIHNNP